MTGQSYLVTGGSGFLGAALVGKLVEAGAGVRVLDNEWRGDSHRLTDVRDCIEIIVADVRDARAVCDAMVGIDRVIHFSSVNGTRFFYEQPELVIDVAVRGILNVIEACRRHGVRELFVASSSEAYQSAPVVPTPEDVPLVIPDVLNPRYSYAGSKLASELIALNYGRTGFDRVIVFRPHNVYGPDMGFEHVIPEFILRAADAVSRTPAGVPVPFPIKGDGEQTRSFIHIDDFTDGLLAVIEGGLHRNVYHIGNPEEVTVKGLARAVLREFGREPAFTYAPAPAGEPRRRCPDIRKLQRLGWLPRIPLAQGLPPVVAWYRANAHLKPSTLRQAAHG
jgi:dTDP-glucose 4,6-dehydratase/UDP-glucose 4-epimerase